ncbi:ATP-binding protein [Thalassobaculum sp. OXR-137]|uniref:ATP-binding protein n=1 Tax=Thalassobaculum sp. OXR-137 TaxID=3100173 RepID=UPI002AC8D76E|nr:ATP-binding protein [Thalassobaculum sp. OXR-137]WPZ33831.1 ATP-binding protein [Thalassobaculum sp. OXR-137]
MSRRWLVFGIVALSVLLGSAGISYWVYHAQRDELVSDASHELSDATVAFTQALNGVFEPALTLGGTVADSGIRNAPPNQWPTLFFAIATGPVRQFEQMSGAFLGFPDGRFLHVQDLEVAGPKRSSSRGPSSRGIYQRVIDTPDINPRGRWRIYDPATGQSKLSPRVTAPYDPRTRGWYKLVAADGKPHWTDVYQFATSGKLGVTYAQPILNPDGSLWAVLGVDLSLTSLSQTLLTTSGALAQAADIVFATDLGDKVLGHPELAGDPADLGASTAEFLERYRDPTSFESLAATQLKHGAPLQIVEAEGNSYLTTKADLDPDRAMPMQIYLARDLEQVLSSARAVVYRNVTFAFLVVVVFGVVASYAVKLRVEVALRQQAEAALIEARDVAEAATQAKSTFLATMSHEIRTPMNGVMSMAELLGLTRLDGEQRRMARIIIDSATALLTIINDILDFSKIEAGKLEIEEVEFSLMSVVGGSAELLAPRAEARGLDLIVHNDPSLIDLRLGDPTRLRQILLNLGGNAVKFTEQGRIDIRVRRVEAGPEETDTIERLRFEVTDTGIGLTEEQRSRLFQAFVQADSSTSRKYGGTGLGLSICQRLTELMGGTIGVDSVAGEGSTFWFELPLAALGDAPPRYPDDLSAASVALVGLGDRLAEVSEIYLRATGIERIDQMGSLIEASGARTLWILRCGGEAPAVADLDRLEGHIAFLGYRGELADLPPAVKSRASALLTVPVARNSLWRAVAIGLGLRPVEEIEVERRDDMAFSPPDVEAARIADALILVAEDNETNQVVVRQMLARMGFACEIVDNGRIALERWRASSGYGLLLTDVNMPEMDGFELARAVRREEGDGGSRLPIVALTADALSGTEETCTQAGMDGYLTKPIDSRKLGEMLARFVPQALALRLEADDVPAEEPAGPVVDWDPEVFDPATLTETFGTLDAEAKELIAGAAATWPARIAEIEAGLADGDKKRARDAAHALKGAALSVGANRLGRIAADLQDYLDDDELEMAGIMAELLTPTFEEFQDILPKIMSL